MKQAAISCEQIDRLMNIKQQQKNVQREIDHIRKTGSKGIKEFSKLIDKLGELNSQMESLIRSM